MLVVNVGDKYRIWVGLLAASFPWKMTEYLWVLRKLVLREKAFPLVPIRCPLGPISEVHVIFSNRDLLLPSKSQP